MNNNITSASTTTTAATMRTINDPTTPLNENEINEFKEAIGINDMIAVFNNMAIKLQEFDENSRIRNEKLINAINKLNTEISLDSNKGNLATIKAIESGNSSTAKAIKENAKSIVENVISQNEKNRKQYWAANNDLRNMLNRKDNSDYLFHSSMSSKDMNRWKKIMSAKVAEQCFGKGKDDFEDFKLIYLRMKEKDGYDVLELIHKYETNHPYASIFDMCAASDLLRMSFEKALNNFYHVNVVTNIKKSKVITYKQAISVPSEIAKIVGRLNQSGSPNGTAYHRAEKILKEKHNVDISAIKHSIMKKYDLSNCNKWFALGQFPKYVELLNNSIPARKGA